MLQFLCMLLFAYLNSSMISNTLRDLTKIANETNSITNAGAIQKRKKYKSEFSI